jgi:hypothetical protein
MTHWGSVFYKTNEEPPTDKRTRVPLNCPVCGIHTEAEIIAYTITPESKFVELPMMGMSVYNYLLRCTRCQSGLLLMWPFGRDIQGGGNTVSKVLLPFPMEAYDTQHFPAKWIPAAILENLRQAELAALAGAPYAAALLLRSACQLICRDKKIPDKGGLDAQIKAIVSSGLITQHIGEMAHGVRIIANEIAHPDPNNPFVITDEDVVMAREFMKQLVRTIYVDPQKAAELKADLAKRGVK